MKVSTNNTTISGIKHQFLGDVTCYISVVSGEKNISPKKRGAKCA